ncbi:hypothetical protein [Aliarcobacter butzleri]|uniref:hypothetical protein n=1 Tax=Aliarcobacter butzleri TaxID=28197 RepID=UPI0015877495|nr:hypothetical protein [Aliarcobacter butzleri]NUW29006.1 hypothetical protein [Aliarcobacter butzleri]
MSNEKEILLTILDEIRLIKEHNSFLVSLIPSELSLSEIAKSIKKSPNTLRKYLISNFEENVDYKKRMGKIFVKQDAILRIRRHYAR